jgi:protein-disulfide isomerase
MKNKIIAFVICLAVLVGAIGYLQFKSQKSTEPTTDLTIASEPIAAEDEIKTKEVSSTSKKAPVSIKDGFLMLGFDDAPVTIIEFSSLSCPHCATFHKDTLPLLINDYINTGKAKIIFRDFPLNASAAAGSLLLKCIPLDKRYEFLAMLFDQQSQWAFDAEFGSKLQQYASLLGISNEKAKSCMLDKEAENEILKFMSLASAQYKIESTPSFVILPGEEKLTGSLNYGAFSTRIEALLTKDK